MIEIEVSTEAALQQLHESKSGGYNHLENIVGGVADQFTW